jgi:hypothetical protein
VPTTSDVREAFVDEITSLGGSIADVLDDGERLYLRPAPFGLSPFWFLF